MNTQTPLRAGLEGVVAAETRLSSVDGLKGELIIGGYALEDFADQATFEETIYLLWHEALPSPDELAHFRHDLAQLREIPDATMRLLRYAASHNNDQDLDRTILPVTPMDVLRMAVDTLSLSLPNDDDHMQTAMRLVATLPTIVASYWRLTMGYEPLAPDSHLSHAANYLYMLTGTPPTATQVRALETYLNTVVDHGLNASTFTARVITSTHSDLVSAIVGAIGALKGPLHGGAPGPALDMVFEIGEPDRAEEYLRAKLEHGERLMGFGHRVYKVYDPRAHMLARAADNLFANTDDRSLYDLVRHVEATALRLLDEYKPGRNLKTNVEFYTALVLYGLKLPIDLFTPTFTISRTVGWLAHCFEQQATGRLIRPQSVYVGPHHTAWVPLEER